jgi:hypothetical protein
MPQQCQHSGCTCLHDASRMIERDGAYYCSETCANAGAQSGPCPCGHPECTDGRKEVHR